MIEDMMTLSDREQVIRDIITKCYNRIYVRCLKVIPFKDRVGFSVNFYIWRNEKPIHIAADLPWEKFLIYYELELRARQLHRDKLYTGYLILPEYHRCCDQNKPKLKTIHHSVIVLKPDILTTSDGYILRSKDGYIINTWKKRH